MNYKNKNRNEFRRHKSPPQPETNNFWFFAGFRVILYVQLKEVMPPHRFCMVTAFIPKHLKSPQARVPIKLWKPRKDEVDQIRFSASKQTFDFKGAHCFLFGCFNFWSSVQSYILAQFLAEGGRFELPDPFPSLQFSRLVHSTTLPPLLLYTVFWQKTCSGNTT